MIVQNRQLFFIHRPSLSVGQCGNFQGTIYPDRLGLNLELKGRSNRSTCRQQLLQVPSQGQPGHKFANKHSNWVCENRLAEKTNPADNRLVGTWPQCRVTGRPYQCLKNTHAWRLKRLRSFSSMSLTPDLHLSLQIVHVYDPALTTLKLVPLRSRRSNP